MDTETDSEAGSDETRKPKRQSTLDEKVAERIAARILFDGRWVTAKGRRFTAFRLAQGRALRTLYRHGALPTMFDLNNIIDWAWHDRSLHPRTARWLLRAGRVNPALVRGKDLSLQVLAALGYLPGWLRRHAARQIDRIATSDLLMITRYYRREVRARRDDLETMDDFRVRFRDLIDEAANQPRTTVSIFWKMMCVEEMMWATNKVRRGIEEMERRINDPETSEEKREQCIESRDMLKAALREHAGLIRKAADVFQREIQALDEADGDDDEAPTEPTRRG